MGRQDLQRVRRDLGSGCCGVKGAEAAMPGGRGTVNRHEVALGDLRQLEIGGHETGGKRRSPGGNDETPGGNDETGGGRGGRPM